MKKGPPHVYVAMTASAILRKLSAHGCRFTSTSICGLIWWERSSERDDLSLHVSRLHRYTAKCTCFARQSRVTKSESPRCVPVQDRNSEGRGVMWQLWCIRDSATSYHCQNRIFVGHGDIHLILPICRVGLCWHWTLQLQLEQLNWAWLMLIHG